MPNRITYGEPTGRGDRGSDRQRGHAARGAGPAARTAVRSPTWFLVGSSCFSYVLGVSCALMSRLTDLQSIDPERICEN
eukprot:4557720-Prymnesium_polylepis.1